MGKENKEIVKHDLDRLIRVKVRPDEVEEEKYVYKPEVMYDNWLKNLLFGGQKEGIYFVYTNLIDGARVSDYEASVEEFNNQYELYYNEEKGKVFRKRFIHMDFENGFTHVQYFNSRESFDNYLRRLNHLSSDNIHNLANLI